MSRPSLDPFSRALEAVLCLYSAQAGADRLTLWQDVRTTVLAAKTRDLAVRLQLEATDALAQTAEILCRDAGAPRIVAGPAQTRAQQTVPP